MYMCLLKWDCWVGGAVQSTLAMSTEQPQMGKGHIRTTKETSKNVYYGFEAMVTNNHYAYMFYEVPTNKY